MFYNNRIKNLAVVVAAGFKLLTADYAAADAKNTFTEFGSLPYLFSDDIQSVDVADLNNDRYIDVIAVGNSGGIKIVMNGLAGKNQSNNRYYFTKFGGFYSGTHSNANAVQAADLDNDGDLDIIVGFDDGEVRIYENRIKK